MYDFAFWSAAAGLLVWMYLYFFHFGFWKSDQLLARGLQDPLIWPEVAILVPARNEGDTIAQCLEGLLNQDYPGRAAVILIDDGSTDDTGEVARHLAGTHSLPIGHSGPLALTVVSGAPLQPGWVGKVWAQAQGARKAEEIHPHAKYYWLSDADIVHAPDTLRRLVAQAEAEHLDLVSLMVHLHCRTAWEKLLIPAFVYFFQLLYPFPAVNRQHPRFAAAAGGCMLVGVSKLGEAGGFRTIRNARIDDCALARTIKQHAGRLFLGLGDDSYSIRPYTGLSDLWSMVARSAFTQLGYSWLLLAGAVSALSLIYLAPPVLSLATASHHNWATGLLALGAWTLLTLSYLPTVRRYQQPIYAALLLPFAALLYIGMTLDSAVRHLRGTDSWKGRTYQQSSPAP